MVVLSNRVTVSRQQPGRDSAGQPIVSWIPVATVWADVRFESGADSIRADKPVSEVRASVKVRMRGDFSAGMRLQYRTHTFKVSAVLPDARERQYMYLVCEAAQ